MGKLLSPEREIEDIEWRALPSIATPAVFATQVGKTIVMRLVGNRYATNAPLICERDLLPGRYPWLADLLAALVKLGAIGEPAMTRHMDLCNDMAEGRQRDIDRQMVDLLAERYGFELTRQQTNAIAGLVA